MEKGSVPELRTNSLTLGMTFVPNSSMLVMSLSCGSVPVLYFMSKRESFSCLTVFAIFAATVSGDPTQSAPSGPASRSKCARLVGDQPRSAPMRFIIRLVVRPDVFLRLSVRRGDMTRRVNRDRQRRLAVLLERLTEQRRKRQEPCRAAADDGDRQRKTVAGSANDRLRTAAHANPRAQRPVSIGGYTI